jgi:predicted PurR-regulated permease PerM
MKKNEIVGVAFEILIKALLLGIVLFYAYSILKPFLIPVLWGVILAVAFFPLVVKLQTLTKLSRMKVVVLLIGFSVALLLVPTYLLSESAVLSVKDVVLSLKEGTLTIPLPQEKIKEWPLVGNALYDLLTQLSTNLKGTLLEFKPQITAFSSQILSTFFAGVGGVFGFVFSLLISAVFLVKADASSDFAKKVMVRLVGTHGEQWANLSALTVRSVAQGVIGIAMFQAFLALIGMVLISVPFAWLWAFGVMMLTIMQLPPIIILGPVIAYVYSYAPATPATIFAIYTLVVGTLDGVLKPLFLGRGVDIPMLVILLGAIGGMLLSGVLGLFVGAVGLALSYKLFMVWLEEEA